MLVRVTSRFDDNPSTVIARPSCSEAESTWPPASGIHSCTPECSNNGAIAPYWLP
jgi:hypothetical protein